MKGANLYRILEGCNEQSLPGKGRVAASDVNKQWNHNHRIDLRMHLQRGRLGYVRKKSAKRMRALCFKVCVSGTMPINLEAGVCLCLVFKFFVPIMVCCESCDSMTEDCPADSTIYL